MRMHFGHASIESGKVRQLGTLALILLLATGADVGAQPASGPGAPTYSLAECLAMAQEKQPALTAARASLAATLDAERGLWQLPVQGRIIARDIPVRRQQAAHGVSAQAANLAQVECDVKAAVSRLYYGVIYAREQRKVADLIVLRLKAVVANGETLLGKEGAPMDLNPFSVGKAKLALGLAETKQDEAKRGLQLALAALREAIGLEPGTPLDVIQIKLPDPLPGVNKDEIIALAVSRRGEISMANSALCIHNLEIDAQSRTRMVKLPSAAAGADFHARPIPTGSFGDDYKPGAIGIDFPTLFAGPRSTRVERACDLATRAGAVADKARNLVALEAESAFLRWEESMSKIKTLKEKAEEGDKIARQAQSALDSGVLQSYRDVLELHVLAAQIQAQLNEALYQHAVALTELERVTAGTFPCGVAVPRAGR